MISIERRIDKLGRIVLPMDFRKALGLEGEAEVSIAMCGNVITVTGTHKSCRLCGACDTALSALGICDACTRKIKNGN